MLSFTMLSWSSKILIFDLLDCIVCIYRKVIFFYYFFYIYILSINESPNVLHNFSISLLAHAKLRYNTKASGKTHHFRPNLSLCRTCDIQTCGASHRQLHPHASESSSRPSERSSLQETPLPIVGGTGQKAERNRKGQNPYSLNCQQRLDSHR